MQAHAVLQATWQRARRPRTWGAALLLGLVWNGATWLLGFQEAHLAERLLPSLWVALFLVLAPVPWQWTGEGAPMAGVLRGATQALVWMAALTFSVVLLLGSLGGPAPGRGPGAGQLERGGPRRGLGPRQDEVGPRQNDLAPRREDLNPRREIRRGLPIHPRQWAFGVALLTLGLLLGWVLADRERAEFQEAAAHRAAREAQARVLQGQMNPHVLFNAISGLTELVREDPAAAEAALVNLSDLLRALLAHGSRLRAPLSEERRLVGLHLALERLRLGHRLRETWDWPSELDALEVPPLMIQPLVENALKHGVALAVGGGELAVQVRQEGGALLIRVANTGPAPPDVQGQGLGLSNLRERLTLLGEPESALSLTRQGEWTVVELRLRVGA